MNEPAGVPFPCRNRNEIFYIYEESLPRSQVLYKGYRLDSNGRRLSVIVWHISWNLSTEEFDWVESIFTELHNCNEVCFWSPSDLVLFDPCYYPLNTQGKYFKGGYCLIYEGARMSLSTWLCQEDMREKVYVKLLKTLIKNVYELELHRKYIVSADEDEVFMDGNVPYILVCNILNHTRPFMRYSGILSVARTLNDRGLITRNDIRFDNFVQSLEKMEDGVVNDPYPWQHSYLLMPTSEMELYNKVHLHHQNILLAITDFNRDWVRDLKAFCRPRNRNFNPLYLKLKSHLDHGEVKAINAKIKKDPYWESYLYESSPRDFLRLVRNALAHPRETAGDVITLENLREALSLCDYLCPLFSNYLLKQCYDQGFWDED